MGLNRAFDRPFFVINGAVKLTGGSLDLAKGQLALIDQSVTTANGAKVVATAAGKQKDAKDFVLRLGVADREANRSYTNKDESTMPFSLNDVVGLSVSAPDRTEQSLDEVIIGYDGFNANSAFSFQTGDAYFRLSLELKGGAVAFRGGKGDTEVVNINVEVPECDPFNNCDTCDECSAVDCKTITLEAIERLKAKQLTGGLTVDQLIDITPVFSCDTPATVPTIDYNYYCLEVCDTGTDEALALVAAQYDTKVVRTDRVGSTSKYQLLLPAALGAPDDFEQTLPSLIKGCSACPAGYTEIPGGFVYSITIEDDGVDATSLLEAEIPHIVVGNTIKADGQYNGVGYYTVVTTQELTEVEILNVLTAGDPSLLTLTFSKPRLVASICEDTTITTIAWTSCGTCEVIEETYEIILPDDECGNDRLEELQAAYNTPIALEASQACQSKYSTTVISNIVCEECDPIFKDYFVSVAPESYDTVSWTLVPNPAALPSGDCLCGIKFKSREFILQGDEALRDLVGFTETSTQIRVSAGYPEEIREGIGRLPKGRYEPKYLSRWIPRTHLAGNLRAFENEGRAYFRGLTYRKDYLGRLLRGETSNMEDESKQYVQYTLKVSHFNHTQGFAGRINEDINYDIFVEVGRHDEVEALLNSIASAAGVPTVKAFA